MSSELLLEWMSQYPKKIISEQVINRACKRIEQSNNREVDSIAKIRRKYTLPLLKFGHIEYADLLNTKYSLIEPTLLVVNSKYTIFCGAISQDIKSKYLENFYYTELKSGLRIYWIDEPIDNIPIKNFQHINISNINTFDILSKIPMISPEVIGKSIDYAEIKGMKRFNPIRGKWEHSHDNALGVYRLRDDIPASVQPWVFTYIKKPGEYRCIELHTFEMTSLALCLTSLDHKQISISYNCDNMILQINLPPKVYLPLMIERPMTWLSLEPVVKNRNYIFKNIDKQTANEIFRIFNLKNKE